VTGVEGGLATAEESRTLGQRERTYDLYGERISSSFPEALLSLPYRRPRNPSSSHLRTRAVVFAILLLPPHHDLQRNLFRVATVIASPHARKHVEQPGRNRLPADHPRCRRILARRLRGGWRR